MQRINSNVCKEKLVCKRCHSKIIDDINDYVIRRFNNNNGRTNIFRIRAEKSKNLIRANNNLFCRNCRMHVGKVFNNHGLNHRYFIIAHRITEAVTIYFN